MQDVRGGAGRSARDLAGPIGMLSIEAELGEAVAYFEGHPGETIVVVMAGSRVVGVLDRGQVEEVLERTRGRGAAERVLIAAMRLGDAVCVPADCSGDALDAAIADVRGRATGGDDCRLVVMDGSECIGLLRSGCDGAMGAGNESAAKGAVFAEGDGASGVGVTALEALLGGCSVPSAVFDDAMRLHYANPAFLALAGLREAARLGWAEVFEEAMPSVRAPQFSRCDAPCSAAHVLTLKRRSLPAVHVQAEVDALQGGRQTMVSILRCIKNGHDVFQGCFCRFKASRHADAAETQDETVRSSGSAGSGQAMRTIVGHIEHFRLVEIAQLIAHSRKTGVLDIFPDGRDARPGEIVFDDGDFRHAVHGGFSGLDAIRSLLAVETGVFHFTEGRRDAPVTIQGKACSILLAACIQMDQRPRPSD